MHSSTSSFRTELKVIAAVLCVLAACELAVRIASPYLDSDRIHIAEFPDISKKLAQSTSPRVLFLGNSLTRSGVDMDIVREELVRRGQNNASIAKIVPVGTVVTDWHYIFEKYFSDVDQCPDIVVIGFVRHHIPDSRDLKCRRLGRYFCEVNHLAEIFEYDVAALSKRTEVLLSRFWATYGEQSLVQERIYDSFIPNYRSATRKINKLLLADEEKKNEHLENPKRTYHRLKRIAELLKKNNTHGIFVAMPLPDVWELDADVAKTVRQCGMTFIDGRKIPGMKNEDFRDGYHLGQNGAKIYSQFIAGKITEYVLSNEG